MNTAVVGVRRAEWQVPAALMALALVPSGSGIVRLAHLAGGGPVTEANARFFAMPVPVVLHILGALPFGLLGALLFAPSFRQRAPRWHRIVGRVLAPLGLVVALSGLWMTLVYPWPAGDGEALYIQRLVFGTAMTVAIVVGVDAVRRRDFHAHGAWMTRAYAIGMGAGTQVFTHLPWFLLFGTPGEGPRAVLMGAGWVINLLVAEWVIQRSRTGPGSPAGAGPRIPATDILRPGQPHPDRAANPSQPRFHAGPLPRKPYTTRAIASTSASAWDTWITWTTVSRHGSAPKPAPPIGVRRLVPHAAASSEPSRLA